MYVCFSNPFGDCQIQGFDLNDLALSVLDFTAQWLPHCTLPIETNFCVVMSDLFVTESNENILLLHLFDFPMRANIVGNSPF